MRHITIPKECKDIKAAAKWHKQLKTKYRDGSKNNVKGIFRDPLIWSTLPFTHTDFIVYSERTPLY